MNNKILKILAVLMCLCMSVPCFEVGANDIYREFYVSQSGSDDNNGTQAAPFATIGRAQQEVRKHNTEMTGDIIVNVSEGLYELDAPLEFTNKDSGFNGFNVIYKGSENAETIISGGTRIGNWTKGENNIWHTTLTDIKTVRELYVDGKPADLAGNRKKIVGVANYIDPNSYFNNDLSSGFYANKSDIGTYENADDVYLTWHQNFRTFHMMVEDIIEDPENPERVIVKMECPAWYETQKSNKYWLMPRINAGFTVNNAFELLDNENEFYYNKKTGVLYYKASEGIDLNSCEVTIPVLQSLIEVKGRDEKECDECMWVRNITFENLSFKYSTWKDADDMSFSTRQADIVFMSRTNFCRVPGAVALDFAKNVNVTDCVFFGIGTAGLSLDQGVINGTYSRNAFANIGCSAIVAGDEGHDVIADGPVTTSAITRENDDMLVLYDKHDYVGDDKPGNVIYGKPYWGSYNFVTGEMSTQQLYNFSMYHTDYRNEFYTSLGTTWYGEPKAKERGIKPWLKFDLQEEYDISEIRIALDSKLDSSYFSDIEVLASNSEDFIEYKVLGQFDQCDYMQTVAGTDGEKYRYIMVGKRNPGPFALSQIWVYSYDRKPLKNDNSCKNIEISNNYIDTIGTYNTSAAAIQILYTDSAKILNNEINNVPYTGISTGWGWGVIDSETTKNNVVAGNKITNYGLINADGGAIYNLGYQPGMKIYENYCTGSMYCGGYYYDNGSAYITSYDNVAGATIWPMFLNTWAHNNNIYNTYSTAGTEFTTQPNNVANSVKSVINDERAMKIIENSGIDKNVRDGIVNKIKAYSPFLEGLDATKGSSGLTTAVETFSHPDILDKMYQNYSQNAKFDGLPYGFEPVSKIEIDELYNAYMAKNGANDLYEIQAAWDRFNRLQEEMILPSYDEMVTMCNEVIKNAKTDMNIDSYSADALSDFKKEFIAVTSNEAISDNDKLYKLAQAYRKVKNAQYSADITAVYMPHGKTVIDKASKTVTVTIPYNLSDSVKKPLLAVSNGAELAVDDTYSYQTQNDIPVYEQVTGKYNYWKLNIVSDVPATSVTGELSGEWYNPNPNNAISDFDGAKLLHPHYDFYVNSGNAYKNLIGFDLKLESKDTATPVIIAFGAVRTDMFTCPSYRLYISGNKMTLKYFNGKTETDIAYNEKSGFNYDEFNQILIKAELSGGKLNIGILVNDTHIINATVDTSNIPEGYMGIISNHNRIYIK